MMRAPNPPQQVLDSPAALAGLEKDVFFALGSFDGVHLGHRALLQQLVKSANAAAALPAALFFDPLPRQVIAPNEKTGLLTPTEEKIRQIHLLDVPVVVKMTFDKTIAAMSPEEFLRRFFLQVPGLRCRGFCVGEGWRFGAGNAGGVKELTAIAAEYGAQVLEVPQVTDEAGKISSTRLRQLVAKGDFAAAARLLGRPYTIGGQVAAGLGVAGEKLKCPTANLSDPSLQLPPYGVYAAWTQIDEEPTRMPAIIYIGDAPTVRGQNNGLPIIEIHLLGYEGNLYGRQVRVEPVEFLRTSMLFPDQQALARQIQQDIQRAKAALQMPEVGRLPHP